MPRKFVLQNPLPRNKKADTITASSSFEAAETILTNLIKEHMPIENRKPGKPMPFMFSIVELKGKKKVAMHFKATITRSKTSLNKDTFTLEKYRIPDSHEMSITVQIGSAHAELQSHHDLVCRLLLEKKNYFYSLEDNNNYNQ